MYRAKNSSNTDSDTYSDTDSDTDTNVYKHLSVLIRYGFLATTKPKNLIAH